MVSALVLIASLLVASLLLWPRLANALTWRAAITPLASIIGSGFLVLGPILDASYGLYAPLVMALLCGLGYLFGSAIRFNIAMIELEGVERSALERGLETISSWSLAFAYIISTAYYMNLFGAFGVSLTTIDDPLHARFLASAMLIIILVVGWTRGFRTLERMEQVSVGIKLAIIAGLLVGLGWYFAVHAVPGGLYLNPSAATGWHGMTLFFGLLITVQGFETSRYLGATYDARRRIRSMRLAQGLSSAIYLVYIIFLAYSFERGTFQLSETAIIDLTRVVAPVLPVLLVVAALSAQFSAAVADTGGSGGLAVELTGGIVSERLAYAILVALGLMITWTANVFEIISYASRAFALYYALQSAIAAALAWRTPGHRRRFGLHLALTLLGILILVFGTPAESN